MRKLLALRLIKVVFYLAVISLSWTIALYLRSDVSPPRAAPAPIEWEKAKSQSKWFPKNEKGINHIFLEGSAFERGLAWGSLPGDLLYRQEKTLVNMYTELMPSKLKRRIFETGAIAAFQGLELSLDPWMLEEMWGVSQSSTSEFNHFASPYARQIAYHGIHEVGQLFVDLAPLEGACTFVSYPLDSHWIVGRTFDFEGGRIFDEEKVVKWVYPDNGFKYVSVAWTGMVGTVSGVNEKGIYVSINAAGSREVNLRGLPSTLILTKVLQEAATLEDALKIFRDTPSMVTDIYMVLDSKSGRLFKVEKSAFSLDMSEVKTATAVTNHLEAEVFQKDDFNLIRKNEYTSTHRLKRAQSLLDQLFNSKVNSTSNVISSLLDILRDKGVDKNSAPLHLGNRRAIDALIAAHGILFDSKSQTLYVGEGPSMSGAFRAYDIQKTFAQKTPVEKEALPADKAVSKEQYQTFKSKLLQLKQVFALLKRQECQVAYDQLAQLDFNHVEYFYASALASSCLGKKEEAKAFATKGLALSPPHKSLEAYFGMLGGVLP
jgi:isopenicillin-N N-acyltransferase like protein